MEDVFNKLYTKDVTGRIKKNQGLNYLSWTWAWAEVKKEYPDANYEIKRFGEDKLPYVHDENTGYMVFTEVTIRATTHEMWLPVMDGANKAMKSKPYKYMTKKGERVCQAASMFDVNKAIMRCLTKNLAMFGLGLHIYAGEDLPEPPPEPKIRRKTIESIKQLQKEFEAIADLDQQNKMILANHIFKNLLQAEDFEKASELNGQRAVEYLCKKIGEYERKEEVEAPKEAAEEPEQVELMDKAGKPNDK